MKLARPIVAAFLVFASAAHAQRGRTADENPRPSVLIESSGGFDIRFEGGTLQEYVGALRRAGQSADVPVNVNLTQEACEVRIDPIVLRGVNLGVALSTVQYATVVPLSVDAVYDPTSPNGLAGLAPAFVIRLLPTSHAPASSEEIEVFPVSELVESSGGTLELESVLTAVREALVLSGGGTPEVRFHESSGLLLVKARPGELEAARKVMNTMRVQANELSHSLQMTSAQAAEKRRMLQLAESKLRQVENERASAERRLQRAKDRMESGAVSVEENEKAGEELSRLQFMVEQATIEAEHARAELEYVPASEASSWHADIESLRAEVRSLMERVARLEAR